jgi:hypothetical protein
MPSQAALLVGNIVHCRKQWEAFSSIVMLKVYGIAVFLQLPFLSISLRLPSAILDLLCAPGARRYQPIKMKKSHPH